MQGLRQQTESVSMGIFSLPTNRYEKHPHNHDNDVVSEGNKQISHQQGHDCENHLPSPQASKGYTMRLLRGSLFTSYYSSSTFIRLFLCLACLVLNLVLLFLHLLLLPCLLLWHSGDERNGAPRLKKARWFSFDELKRCINNFSMSNEIGSRGYGIVIVEYHTPNFYKENTLKMAFFYPTPFKSIEESFHVYR